MKHPITSPPELVQQWKRTAPHRANEHEHYHYITLCAAQWGADQELEACCEWLFKYQYDNAVVLLRDARRPKPPSLKEQAFEKLMNLEQGTNPPSFNDYNTIRRALEALPND